MSASEYGKCVTHHICDCQRAKRERLEKALKIAVEGMREAINGLYRGFSVEAEKDLREAQAKIESILKGAGDE